MRIGALIAAGLVVFGMGIAQTAHAYTDETFSLVPAPEQEEPEIDEQPRPLEEIGVEEIHAQDPESWRASLPSTGHYNPGPLEDVTLP